MTQTTNSLKVYNEAKACLGQALSASNPGFGCALAVNAVFQKALGVPVGGGASTNAMHQALQDKTRFTQVLTPPLPGDIIISATGFSGLGADQHGHVGILGRFGIMSNDSESGLWQENYSIDSWTRIFQGVLQFPVEYYRVL